MAPIAATDAVTLRSEKVAGAAQSPRIRFDQAVSVPLSSDGDRLDAVGALTVYVALFFFIPSQWVLPGLGAAGRPAGLFGLGLFALWMVAKALPNIARRRSPIRWFLLGYALTVITSYSLAYDRGLREAEALAADRALITLVSQAGVILIAAEGLPTLRHVFTVGRRLSMMSSAVVVAAVIQFVFKFDLFASLRFPGLVLNTQVNTLTVRGSGGLVRVKGSMLHPIEFGVAMGMLLPIVLHFALHEPEKERRRIWMIMAALHAAGSAMAVSRSAVLASATAGAILFWAWSPVMRLKALFAAAGLAVLLRGAVPGLLGTILSLFTNWSQDPSIQGRTNDYGVIGAYIFDRPFFGRGPDTFIPDLYLVLDNAYLLGLVSIGFVGMGALILLMFSGIGLARSCARRSRSDAARHLAIALTGTIAVALTTSVTFDFFSFPTVTSLLVLAIGLTAALAQPIDGSTASFAPPDLLRPSYRSGYPRVPWWHHFDPELRRVLRRDNRMAAIGGANQIWTRRISVAYYPFTEDVNVDPNLVQLIEAARHNNVKPEQLTIAVTILSPPDVLHVSHPEQRLSGKPKDWARGLLLLPAIAVARRRGSVLVGAFEHARPVGGRFTGWYLTWFDRMVDAAIFRSKEDAGKILERRPSLRPASHHLIRYGHLRQVTAWLPSPSRARQELRLATDRSIVVVAGPIDQPEIDALTEVFQHADDLNLSIVVATRHLANPQDIRSVARRRVRLIHGPLPFQKLLLILRAADLVVVPWKGGVAYRSIMTALSVDKPVLAPWQPELAELRDRTSGGWVRLYDDQVRREDLTHHLGNLPTERTPNLGNFDWSLLGGAIRTVYEDALCPTLPTVTVVPTANPLRSPVAGADQ